MKRKILLSPLFIILFIVLFGIGVAGAAIYFGGGTGGETNSQSINLQKGLVGHWKFDGNAKDSSSNSNHGTLNGSNIALTTDRKGQTNKAYSFNGTSDYIDAGNNSLFGGEGQSFTIESWVKRNSSGAYHLFIGAEGGLHFGWRNTNVFTLDFSGNGVDTTLAYPDVGEWHHWTGTYDGITNNRRIYRDGILVAEDTSASDYLGSGVIDIGRYAGAYYLPGLIDEVRVYNRALSAAEVLASYESYDPGIVVSDLQKGLVGNWKFNGNAKDSTANSNHGTVTGATLTTDRKGQVNKAYSFNGTSDYVNAGSGASLKFGVGNFTIEAWALCPSYTQRRMLLGQDYGDGVHIYVDLPGGDVYRFLIYTAGQQISIDSQAGICDNQWHHLVFLWDRPTGRLFVDGVLKDTGTNSNIGSVTNTQNWYIGRQDAGVGYWNGSIDDVRIYNRALSQAEITARYESYDPGITISSLQKGLVGHWKMDGNAKDATANSNHGTVTGAVLAPDRKGQVNKAYSFNGVDDYVSVADSPAWDFGANPFNVSFWVYLDSTPGASETALAHGTYYDGWTIWLYGTSVRFYSAELYRGWANAFSIGSWNYISINGDGTNMELFSNGSSLGSQSYQAGWIQASVYVFTIGSEVSAGRSLKSGTLDEVRIYNRVLSQTEVTALYESY